MQQVQVMMWDREGQRWVPRSTNTYFEGAFVIWQVLTKTMPKEQFCMIKKEAQVERLHA